MGVLTATGKGSALERYRDRANQLRDAGTWSDDLWSACAIHRTHMGLPLDFVKHPYLTILYSQVPTWFREGKLSHFTSKKGTQAGLTEWLVWFTIMQAMRGLRTFYVLPTVDLLNRFVQERWDRCVDYTPAYWRYIQQELQRDDASGRRHAQSMKLKQFGPGTVAFVGSNSSVGFTEFVADIDVEDEVDECDQKNLKMAPERMSHSDYRWRIRSGNPTIPDFGISEDYSKGSRHRWMVQCDRGHRQVMDFFKNVVHDEGEGNYRVLDPDWEPMGRKEATPLCECGAPIDRRQKGEWVAENQAAFNGGHMSMHFDKLFTGTMTTDELLERLEEGVRSDEAMTRFWNGDLGLEWLAKGSKIDDEMLDACVGEYTMPNQGEPGLVLAGIDVGARFHIWIARLMERNGETRLKSLWIDAVKTPKEVMELLRRYRVVAGVIDLQPETRVAKAICRRHRGMFACYFSPSDGTLKRDIMLKGTKIFTVDRTGSIDAAKEAVMARLLLLPRNARSIPDLYDQLKASVRVFDPKANKERGAWKWVEGNKKDHYLLALTYLIMARAVALRIRKFRQQAAAAEG